ncbi:MAG: glycoside hydrolase family 57 protein [Leptospirillia bacterium]
MEKGYFSLVLHAHLPFVRHPEYPEFMEEDWLFEAIGETYIPLIAMMHRLQDDGIPFALTMSLTPPLCEMLSDPLLMERYDRRLRKQVELAEKEITRTGGHDDFNNLARYYLGRFTEELRIFEEECGRNLLGAFRRFQDAGLLEIMTCGATHGFFPLMQVNERAVRAQVRVAVANYRKHFGRGPRGIWLPECGYYPGVDRFLKEEGIEFFLVETHGILHASTRPRYGVFAPLITESGVAAFGRDQESSRQVWSAEEGYPGDPDYRDFYRDIGFDLEHDYIGPYIHPDGIPIHTGFKYHRITGKGVAHKEPYRRDWAMEKAASHAGNFLFNRERQIENLSDTMGERKPLVVAPYDAELFGHWWYEGPEFLENLFRKMACDQDTVRAVTPAIYLDENPVNQRATPALSSWGAGGYNEYWLEGSNAWVYRHLHQAADRMCELADRFPDANGLLQRALNQAGRELLLAQSSDWAFILKTDTTVEYAAKRTRDHTMRFTRLYEEILENRIDEGFLKECEWLDSIFQEIDYRAWAGPL